MKNIKEGGGDAIDQGPMLIYEIETVSSAELGHPPATTWLAPAHNLRDAYTRFGLALSQI